MTKIAAIIYALLAGFVVFFQIALIFGAPLGEYAMGGIHKGAYDLKMKIMAFWQIILIIVMALIVLRRAKLVKSLEALYASKASINFVLIMSLFSVLVNFITPSEKERMLWIPVALIMFICALIVAFKGNVKE